MKRSQNAEGALPLSSTQQQAPTRAAGQEGPETISIPSQKGRAPQLHTGSRPSHGAKPDTGGLQGRTSFWSDKNALRLSIQPISEAWSHFLLWISSAVNTYKSSTGVDLLCPGVHCQGCGFIPIAQGSWLRVQPERYSLTLESYQNQGQAPEPGAGSQDGLRVLRAGHGERSHPDGTQTPHQPLHSTRAGDRQGSRGRAL